MATSGKKTKKRKDHDARVVAPAEGAAAETAAAPPDAKSKAPAEPRGKSAAPAPAAAGGPVEWVLRGADSAFRFLASLKLAVITLSTLVAVLAFATYYESCYGSRAVAEDVYKSPVFALVLTFLGANILCAALIRYPWKRRQTGFVITHAGLLTVLVGTFLTLKFSDEGMMSVVEGGSNNKVVRSDISLIRVRPLNEDGKATEEHRISFQPGTDVWNPEKPDLRRLYSLAFFKPSVETVGRALIGTFAPSKLPRKQMKLPAGDDRFRLEVLDHLPESSPKWVHESAQGGAPMLHIEGTLTPPNSPESFPIDEWITANNPLKRASSSLRVAIFTLQAVDDPTHVDDFLDVPIGPEARDVAWVRYEDKSGRPRREKWLLDPTAEGQTLALPDSDVTLKFMGVTSLNESGLQRMAESDNPAFLMAARRFAQFMVADEAEELLLATFTSSEAGKGGAESPIVVVNRMPAGSAETALERGGSPGKVRIAYLRPRVEGGEFGRLEVMALGADRLHYRVIGRDGVRSAGKLEKGATLPAFGNTGGMRAEFRVPEYFESGRRRLTFEATELPANDKARAIPAALVRMTAGGESQDVWLRPDIFQENVRTVRFKNGQSYEISYDIKRHEIDMDMKLVDFEIGFEPGTTTPTSYTSEILVDEPRSEWTNAPDRKVLAQPTTFGVGGVLEELDRTPYTVTMNVPYRNGYWTFYQANYQEETDARGQGTGVYSSVFQVRYDPTWVWGVVYLGCATVVFGTFVQFYMKAGVFSGNPRRPRAGSNGKSGGKPEGDDAKDSEPQPDEERL